MIFILNAIGVILLMVIVWWFWLSKAKAAAIHQSVIQISVKDGVYSPASIECTAQQRITLEFLRVDRSACSEYVIFESLGIHQKLPLDKAYQIHLPALTEGRYPFSCQMNMYRGELIVK
jgi:plastocyanin domain-containing protein